MTYFNGSTANNLVWPRSDGRLGHPPYAYHEPGSVFIDTKPGVPPSERYKMVASWKGGVWLLTSPDGTYITYTTYILHCIRARAEYYTKTGSGQPEKNLT